MKKKFDIEYSMYSTLGKIRRNNEDNYYVDGKIREDLSLLSDECITGMFTNESNEMVAVFDGMGGEACGEIASYVAARTCKAFSQNKNEYEEYLYELCKICNDEILNETQKRSLVLMGTTGCMIQFGSDDIYILNVGDSRIYKKGKTGFSMVSKDHVAHGYGNKAPLTRFLGMKLREEEDLNPYIAMGTYKDGDIFMMCTDGITDMIPDIVIESILDKKKTSEEMAKELANLAIENGGLDNATVLICKISKSK